MITTRGIDNVVKVHESAEISKSTISIIGKNNKLIFNEGVKIRSSNIRLKGENITLVVDNNVEMTGVIASLFSSCSLKLGKDTTMGNGELTIAEGCDVVIGKDCMFAHGYDIRTSDMHPIYDLKNGKRINYGSSIIIGDHVWFGRNVFVQKGVTIANNIVVGARSVVSRSLITPNSIAVGIPAKIIKEGIVWGRKMYHQTMYDDPTLKFIINDL